MSPSPSLTIPVTPVEHKLILRGDLVKGGAKMPALLRYLLTLHHTDFAYVGSVYGSGAWAVAVACAELGYACSLYLSKSKHTPPWLSHVERTGAIVNWCDPSPVATLHDYVTRNEKQFYNLPLGFDDPDFIAHMAQVLRESIPDRPPEIWVSSLSGVLARAACAAFPHIPVHAVSAAKYRGDIGRAIIHQAPEKFHQPSTLPPPYPACPYSCAKIWPIARQEAVDGAYILNVGYAA